MDHVKLVNPGPSVRRKRRGGLQAHGTTRNHGTTRVPDWTGISHTLTCLQSSYAVIIGPFREKTYKNDWLEVLEDLMLQVEILLSQEFFKAILQGP